MENTDICKTLLNIVLHDKTDTITDIQLTNFQLLFFPCILPSLLLYYFYAEFQNRITTV